MNLPLTHRTFLWLGELQRQGFRGVASIECAHDSERLLEEVAARLAFVESTAKRLEAK